MSKYTTQIQERIKEYNEDFEGSLLKGLKLVSLSCQAYRGNKKWYSSNANENSLENRLFKNLESECKNKEENTKKEEFISVYKYNNKTINFHCDELSLNKVFQNNLLEICNKEFNRDILLIFKNEDINGDNNIDMAFMSIFELTENYIFDKEKIKRFTKYPEDFFTSPYIEDFLNTDMIKEEKEQELVLLYNNIKSYSHIIYNNIAGNLNDYERLESENLSKNAKINFDNIKKRGNFIRAMLQIIGRNKLDETINEFSTEEYKKIAGVIDFLRDNYVNKTQSGSFNFKKHYPYEHLKHSVEGKQSHIFILLWNLLSNADKHKNSKEFGFNIFEKDYFLTFVISNDAEEEDRKAIENIINDTIKSDADRGAWAIKEYCDLLNWEISFIDNPNKVEICIKTNIQTH